LPSSIPTIVTEFPLIVAIELFDDAYVIGNPELEIAFNVNESSYLLFSIVLKVIF
jgi:hypothetical protein